MRTLTFDREAHVYHLGTEEVPGITAMLRAAGLTGSVENIPVEYRDRGSAVHRWIEADLHGRVKRRTPIPPVVLPYLTAARMCIAATGAKIRAIEELVCNRAVPYATQIDIRAKWKGTEWIWNWKTGREYPFYPVQLALEALCYPTHPRRACVYLTRDATYSIQEHGGIDALLTAKRVMDHWRGMDATNRERALRPWKYRDQAAAAVREQAEEQDRKGA